MIFEKEFKKRNRTYSEVPKEATKFFANMAKNLSTKSIIPTSQEYAISSMPDVKVKNQPNVSDNSLENAINLVDEWMTDESGYDEEVYPEIENELNKKQVSF